MYLYHSISISTYIETSKREGFSSCISPSEEAAESISESGPVLPGGGRPQTMAVLWCAQCYRAPRCPFCVSVYKLLSKSFFCILLLCLVLHSALWQTCALVRQAMADHGRSWQTCLKMSNSCCTLRNSQGLQLRTLHG